MAKSASLMDSDSPQVIIEKLAQKRISEEEAESSLKRHWRRAYDTPTLVRFFREVFKTKGSVRRTGK